LEALKKLIKKKREAIAKLVPQRRMDAWEVHDVFEALHRSRRSPLRIIAEIKLRSPDGEPLAHRDTIERAVCYDAVGVDMISVDIRHAGSYEDVKRVRYAALSKPILCNDIVIDPMQVFAAWSFGADAILLIARCLPGSRLADLVKEARRIGLEPVVEVTNRKELDRAIDDADAHIVLVCKESEKTEVMSVMNLVNSVQDGDVAIHSSRLHTPSGVNAIARTGADAALLSDALMQRKDPSELLHSLLAAAVIQ